MKIAIFGTSGFAREVADICWEIGYEHLVFIGIEQSEDYFGYKVKAESSLEELNNQNYKFIIGIGDNFIRENIVNKYKNLRYINVIHPSASFGKNQLDKLSECKGNVVAAGVRFTNNIMVGNFGIYNLNSTIGHDCIIGDYVNISPNVGISGNVSLRNQAFVGTNATIIQGKTIGKCSVVGAGSVVIDNVPDNCTVVGTPAKKIH